MPLNSIGHIRLLAAVLSALLWLLAPAPAASADEAEPATVRIGYYKNAIFQKGVQPGAARSGYAYEYCLKIAEYAGWQASPAAPQNGTPGGAKPPHFLPAGKRDVCFWPGRMALDLPQSPPSLPPRRQGAGAKNALQPLPHHHARRDDPDLGPSWTPGMRPPARLAPPKAQRVADLEIGTCGRARRILTSNSQERIVALVPHPHPPPQRSALNAGSGNAASRSPDTMKLATFALCAAGAFCLMALPLPSCARPLPAASSPDEIPEPEAMAGGGVSDLSSRNAPTKIASRDLIRFSCQFNALPSPSVPCRDGSIRISVHSGEPAGRYSVELEKTARGARFRVACADWQSGRETHRAEGDAPASALAGLQRILEEHDTASLNGYYKRNTALGEGFRLDVRYASGESIAAGAEGGASVMPARGLPLEAFRRFFLELAAKAGKPLYNDKPLQGGISFLQYEFLLAGTPPVPAFSSLPAGIVRLAISRENKAKARVYAGWSNPAESRKRNALVWTTIFEAEVPAVWLDRLQDCFGKHQLARLNGYRHCEGTGVPGMHFDPTLQAAVRMIGDWESGESYEVLAYGREGHLPARDYLDDSWMPAFFAQLAKENGLPLTLTHEP